MRHKVLMVSLVALSAQLAMADAPATSLFPKLRELPTSGFSEQVLAPLASIPPQHRPDAMARQKADSVGTSSELVVPDLQSNAKSPRNAKGSVCGDPAIKGEVLAPIASRVKGCGVAEPVSVTSIDGVGFSQPATIDCPTAKAFKTWIQKGMRPAFGNRKVVGLHIFGSYMCRSRNNIRGAKVSEHGRGKAVDVAGFQFSDGTEWTVLHDYNKQIRKAHKAACGIFGTTLGPGSDGFHENHLHFDTASYRSGPYCR